MDECTAPTRFPGRTSIQLLLLTVVALIAYSNSFHVPFIFDDETSITKNEVIRDLANFFTNRSGYDYLPNRFIGYLTFAFNYSFGGFNVVGYHVINLIIHLVNALFVYSFMRLTLRTPFFSESGQKTDGSGLHDYTFLPFFAALFFVCHPIQTQAVTYIVQRLTSLSTLFFMGSLLLHIRWRTARESGSAFTSGRVLPFFLLSLAMALLAMKTKEIAFTLPFVVLLYEICFFGRPHMKRLAELMPMLLTMLIIPLTMITLNKPVSDIISDVSKVTTEGKLLSRWEYLCTQFSVITTYIRLLLLPVNQNLDYDYPINRSLLEPRAFLSLSLLSALFALGVYLFFRSTGKINSPAAVTDDLRSNIISARSSLPELRLAAFGIFWFFITLSVESSLIPISDVIYEHRVYLPSVGFLVALTSLAFVGLKRMSIRIPSAHRAGVSLLLGVAVILTVTTYTRNNVWSSWESLWQDVQKNSPLKPRAYNNLGAYYVKQERPFEAIREFEMSIRLNPQYLDSLYNLAMLYVWAGRIPEAKQISDTLQKLDPETFKTLDAMYGNK